MPDYNFNLAGAPYEGLPELRPDVFDSFNISLVIMFAQAVKKIQIFLGKLDRLQMAVKYPDSVFVYGYVSVNTYIAAVYKLYLACVHNRIPAECGNAEAKVPVIGTGIFNMAVTVVKPSEIP